MASTSGAYDSLQRMLSPSRARSSPTGTLARKPIPHFAFEPAPPVTTAPPRRRRVVSPSLSWWEMKELLELEYRLGRRAPPLLDGRRKLLSKDLSARRSTGEAVQVALLSDSVLIEEEGKVELVPAGSIAVEDLTLTLAPSSSDSSPRVLHLDPSPDISAALSTFSASFASQSSSSLLPSPLTPTSAWTPDSTLSLCECCATVRFNTLTRKHHCRKCGRGICGRCSRFAKVAEAGAEDRTVRVCSACFDSQASGER